jgi:hypothetical protein
MALPVTPPYVFGNVTSSIPLTNLDADFATIYAAVNGIGNGTVSLANVSITGGTISNVSETATSYVATKVISTSSNIGAYSYGTLSYSDVNIFESFSASANTYVQNILQNTNAGTAASTDYIVSNNLGTATTYYGNFGMNGSGWTGTAGTNSFNAPNMVYLTSTTGDLLLGTTTANTLRFATNAGADSMQINGTTGIVSFPTTNAITLPNGTTGQQPTGVAGMLRFNSTTTQFEGYNGTSWASVGGAAGSNTQVQFNSSGALAGSANMTFDGSTLTTLNSAYTGTLTGGTGVVNLGSGQFYKDASGNVGIGTTTGITTVSSGLAINNPTATNYPGLEIQTSGVTRMYFNANNAASYISSVGTNPLAIYTNGSERMRIDSSGNLLVGTTSSSGKTTVNAGTSSATTYNTLSLIGGSSVTSQQQSTSVSTSATVILTPNLYASFCIVFGSDGTNRFMDLILCTLASGTVQVVASSTVSGTPAARTYSQSSSTYRLAMASGTYTVQVSATSMTG